MTLFKLSVSNMKKSIKDYAIYFFTLVLGVAIFYVFNAIETQTAMLQISADTRQVVQLMSKMIAGVSVFIAFVLGFLIIYASRFLMKRRNKEFGLYLILGMGKRKVSTMLFIETLIIGLVSLVVGLLAGIGISQLTSVLVANMFDADMSSYSFVFSGSAFAKTCLYFAIIYVVVIIFNTFIISKCKLIDLFQNGRKSENVKIKNPWVSVIVFLISVVSLGYAYHAVITDINDMYMNDLYKWIVVGCVATVLFFWSVSGMLFRIVSSMKNVYYKGLNTFVVRQMSSRVNTNVLSISVICLMLFVTICVLSSALAVKNSLNEGIAKYARADVSISKTQSSDSIYYDEDEMGARIFAQEFNFPIVGLPGTIDNDLYGTDTTIGYDTALNTIMECVDKIRDTATSHDRLFFVEVMGRDAGFLALNGAIASGAEAAIIPEISLEKDQLAEMIENGFRKSKNSSIVLVAESEVTGGAMGVAERVKKEYPQFDVRVSILGHLQRGGSPTAQDRILATRMGVAAIDALLDDQRNVMMGIQNDQIVYVPFSKAIKNDKPINRDLLNTLRVSSI